MVYSMNALKSARIVSIGTEVSSRFRLKNGVSFFVEYQRWIPRYRVSRQSIF